MNIYIGPCTSSRKIIKTIGIVLALAFLNACGSGDDTEFCDDDLVCSNYGTKINTCCDSDECWYETNGQTFVCAELPLGTDGCESAATELINYCESGRPDDLASKLQFEKAKNKTLALQNKTLKIQLDQAHEDVLKLD